jgi:hypothetical protein
LPANSLLRIWSTLSVSLYFEHNFFEKRLDCHRLPFVDGSFNSRLSAWSLPRCSNAARLGSSFRARGAVAKTVKCLPAAIDTMEPTPKPRNSSGSTNSGSLNSIDPPLLLVDAAFRPRQPPTLSPHVYSPPSVESAQQWSEDVASARHRTRRSCSAGMHADSEKQQLLSVT